MASESQIELIVLMGNGDAHARIDSKDLWKPYGEPIRNPPAGGVYLEGMRNQFAVQGTRFDNSDDLTTYVGVMHDLDLLVRYALGYLSDMIQGSPTLARRHDKVRELQERLRQNIGTLQDNHGFQAIPDILSMEPGKDMGLYVTHHLPWLNE
ncbi:hypothetical protein HYS47_01375 [Candidatus Woesearchaeota archaeon]|nr:hypothetical protein [Candidatus Woesearchaeota archaeon]